MQNERTRDGKYAQHKGPHKTPNRRQFKTKQNNNKKWYRWLRHTRNGFFSWLRICSPATYWLPSNKRSRARWISVESDKREWKRRQPAWRAQCCARDMEEAIRLCSFLQEKEEARSNRYNRWPRHYSLLMWRTRFAYDHVNLTILWGKNTKMFPNSFFFDVGLYIPVFFFLKRQRTKQNFKAAFAWNYAYFIDLVTTRSQEGRLKRRHKLSLIDSCAVKKTYVT